MFIFINSGINQHFPLFSTDRSGMPLESKEKFQVRVPVVGHYFMWEVKLFLSLLRFVHEHWKTSHSSCIPPAPHLRSFILTQPRQVYHEKSSEGLKNIHGVHQTISLCFFNSFKSAFLGLHLKRKTASSAVRTLSCHIVYGVVRHNSLKSLSIHHLFPSRNFFFFSFLDCLWLLFIYLVSWLQGTFLLAG